MAALVALLSLAAVGCWTQQDVTSLADCPDGTLLKDLHVQVLFAHDLAAFDDGYHANSNSFVQMDIIQAMMDLDTYFGKAETSMFFYGDKLPGNPGKCARIHTPMGPVTDAVEDMLKYMDDHENEYWDRSTKEGSQLQMLRYAMRQPGWAEGERDENGKKIVKIIYIITDVAGTLGDDESDLPTDPSTCDSFGYPSMNALRADQQKYFADGIFLLMGDIDSPAFVRDPVVSFTGVTLPFYLNGARGATKRIPTTGVHHYETTNFIRDAACGLIGEKPSVVPEVPTVVPVPMSTKPSTTTGTTLPPIEACPNGLRFDDVHLQLLLAFDMAAFKEWSSTNFLRMEPYRLVQDLDKLFGIVDFSGWTYSDRLDGVGHRCANQNFDFMSTLDAESQLAALMTIHDYWNRSSADGSQFQMLRYAFRSPRWYHAKHDEQGRKIVQVIAIFTDAPGALGSDESDLTVNGEVNPSDCDSFDYPTADAVSQDHRNYLPNANFLLLGHANASTSVDVIDNFNQNVLPNILNHAAGRAEIVRSDNTFAEQTHQFVMEAVCGILVSPEI